MSERVAEKHPSVSFLEVNVTPNENNVPKTRVLARRFCLEKTYPVTLFFRNARLRGIVHGDQIENDLENLLAIHRLI